MMIVNQNTLNIPECLHIINYLEVVDREDAWSASTDPYWDRRTIEIINIREPSVMRVLRKAYDSVRAVMPDGYEASSFRIVMWLTGTWADVHTDDIYVGREYSSIIYLNDDFEGGHTVFPDHGLDIKPEAGKSIVFQGNSEMPHQVTKVTSGVRFTMTGFWTGDVEQQAYKGWSR